MLDDDNGGKKSTEKPEKQKSKSQADVSADRSFSFLDFIKGFNPKTSLLYLSLD